ncbi:transmembrane protein 82-like [Gouania willdenowi]|uniref:Transmembrane protein 82-like n=1 Tax=Gouania willdenowi TaxID=441366 RepID=A0A8C5DNG4_GOUWI|nr:transmembrane protein 82-like [Gouania willdenowi]
MFSPFRWILGFSEWMPFESSPVDCLLQGVVGACGISVMCNLMRLYYFIQTCNDCQTVNGSKSSAASSLWGTWRSRVQFWFLTGILSLVGIRVSSLIVLEFCLRAVSGWASAGLDASGKGPDLLLVQCQFSLGCSLSCTLAFLHQGALHSSFSLFLAAALSWVLAGFCYRMWSHAASLYLLHSTDHYCGKCIALQVSGHTILTSVQKAVVLAFAFAAVAAISTVHDHFLSQRDALKLWTPLTLCYSMLLFYMREEQSRQTAAEFLLHTVVMRLGGLLVLMLLLGHWSDIFDILIAFIGEAVCLLPSGDLLQATVKEEEETGFKITKESLSHRGGTRPNPSKEG